MFIYFYIFLIIYFFFLWQIQVPFPNRHPATKNQTESGDDSNRVYLRIGLPHPHQIVEFVKKSHQRQFQSDDCLCRGGK